ncbi:MAG: hypothetical protein JST23_05570 [Bacteroidetes bacterium]|nr:hypothetical protein [Bacteroidota bacterium]
MKKLYIIVLLFVATQTVSAQNTYFTCNELGVYLNNGSVTIKMPGLSKEKVKQKIQSFIKEKKYVYKPYYSNENMISFRDFVIICHKSKCGTDLIAKTIFHLAYDSEFVKITLDTEIYSSFYGTELIINDNDDVVSKKDVPFAPYEFQIPEQYSKEYPESIYVFNKKGKIKVQNQEVQKLILSYFNQYITDLVTYFEN